jgi:hypothetical protein
MYRADGRNAKRCPECGVEFRAGGKYCDFCGTKIASEVAVRPPAESQQAAHGSAAGMLKGVAVVCLALGVLGYVGGRLRGPDPSSPPPAPIVADSKHQASAICETAIRAQARGPFRVIAFRSALVAEERGEYVVTGTVELQSTAGDLQRKRYFCRVHPDPRAGMVLDEGKMY